MSHCRSIWLKIQKYFLWQSFPLKKSTPAPTFSFPTKPTNRKTVLRFSPSHPPPTPPSDFQFNILLLFPPHPSPHLPLGICNHNQPKRLAHSFTYSPPLSLSLPLPPLVHFHVKKRSFVKKKKMIDEKNGFIFNQINSSPAPATLSSIAFLISLSVNAGPVPSQIARSFNRSHSSPTSTIPFLNISWL